MFRIHPQADTLSIIAGPCVIESQQLLHDVAGPMTELCREYGLPYVFKASYRKANRTSNDSFQGLGDEQALEYLAEIRSQYGCAVVTDIHEAHEARVAAKYVDVLQIPAFLFRQTDLLKAAGQTGCAVNIKKGQFAAPEDMSKAVAKVKSTCNDNVWVCERGTTFGYHDLVVDMRSLIIMRQTGCPVIFDATHSVQKPSLSATSGGVPEFIPALTRAAVAVGIDGLFFETHPEPARALSDAATQLPLSKAREYVERTLEIDALVRKQHLNSHGR